MRLWHYKIIPYLPKSQLIAQWRELNSIYKKQDNHILINYIYEVDNHYMYTYSQDVINEILERGYKIKKFDNYINYFKDDYYGHFISKKLNKAIQQQIKELGWEE